MLQLTLIALFSIASTASFAAAKSESPEIEAQADAESPTVVQSATSLQTPDELNVLFSTYQGRYKERFTDVVNQAFEAETRNDTWAHSVEEEVEKVTSSIPGFSMEGGECRMSLCRYYAFSNELSVKTFSRNLVDSSKANSHPVIVLRRLDNESQKFVLYLFSVKPPAAWVKTLK